MARTKVTLTLDIERLEELRSLVGARSLSAAVDNAIAAPNRSTAGAGD